MEKSSHWQITQGREKMMDLQDPSAVPIFAPASCTAATSWVAAQLWALTSAVVSQLLQCPWVTALGRLSSSLPCMVTSSSKKWDGFSICGRETFICLLLHLWVRRETPALLVPRAEIPIGRKCSSLVPFVQPHSSFPKQGISFFYFSLCPSPGPVVPILCCV